MLVRSSLKTAGFAKQLLSFLILKSLQLVNHRKQQLTVTAQNLHKISLAFSTVNISYDLES